MDEDEINVTLAAPTTERISLSESAPIRFSSQTIDSSAFAHNSLLSIQGGSNGYWHLGSIAYNSLKSANQDISTGGSPSFISIAGSQLQIHYIDMNTTPTITGQEGRIFWNSDDGTINIGMPGGNVNLQVGQENLLRAKNTSGSIILNGQVVYISGASGNKPTISLASASNSITSHCVIGVATEDISSNHNGYVTLLGLVRDINTAGLGIGSTVYLSVTPGGLTNVAPTPPNHRVKIGHVINEHATEGILLTHISVGQDIDELHDVLITSPAGSDILFYHAGSAIWKNIPITQLVPSTGSTDVAGSYVAYSGGITLPTVVGSANKILSSTGSSLHWISQTAPGAGITSINTLTEATQYLIVGTSGANYNIISNGSVHTFNLPTADSTHTGALGSGDWIVFNSYTGSLASHTGSLSSLSSGSAGAAELLITHTGSLASISGSLTSLSLHTDTIGIVVDGAGSSISLGTKGYRTVPFNCTVTGWTVLGKESGSVVVDVKKCTYTGFPTTASIAGSEKPSLSSVQKNQNNSLSTWTTSLTKGDILEFVVDSASIVTRVAVFIDIIKA